jgi:hypothetical protein
MRGDNPKRPNPGDTSRAIGKEGPFFKGSGDPRSPDELKQGRSTAAQLPEGRSGQPAEKPGDTTGAKGGKRLETNTGQPVEQAEQGRSGDQDPEAEGVKGTVVAEEAADGDDSSEQSRQDNTNRGDLNSAWPPRGEWKKQWEQPVHGSDNTISHLGNLSKPDRGTVVDEHAMALLNGDGRVLVTQYDVRKFDPRRPEGDYQRQMHTQFADGRRIEQEFSAATSSDGRSHVQEYSRSESDPNGARTTISINLTTTEGGVWNYTENGPGGKRTISHKFDPSSLKWTTTETRGPQTKEIIEPSRVPLSPSTTLGKLGVEIPSENMIESPLESLAYAESAAAVMPIEEGGPQLAETASESSSTGENTPTAELAESTTTTETDKGDKGSRAGGGTGGEDIPPSNEGSRSEVGGRDEPPTKPPEKTPAEPALTPDPKIETAEPTSGSATPDPEAKTAGTPAKSKPTPGPEMGTIKPPDVSKAETTRTSEPKPAAGAENAAETHADTKEITEEASAKPEPHSASKAEITGTSPEPEALATPGPEASPNPEKKIPEGEHTPSNTFAPEEYDPAMKIPSQEEALRDGFEITQQYMDGATGTEGTRLTRETGNIVETIESSKNPDQTLPLVYTRTTKGADGKVVAQERVTKYTDKTTGTEVTTLTRKTSNTDVIRTETIKFTKNADNTYRIEHTRTAPNPKDGTTETTRAVGEYKDRQHVRSELQFTKSSPSAITDTHVISSANGATMYEQVSAKPAENGIWRGTSTVIIYDGKGVRTTTTQDAVEWLRNEKGQLVKPTILKNLTTNLPFVEAHAALDKSLILAGATGGKMAQALNLSLQKEIQHLKQANPELDSRIQAIDQRSQKTEENMQNLQQKYQEMDNKIQGLKQENRERKNETEALGRRTDMLRRSVDDINRELRNGNGGRSNVIKIPTDQGMMEVPIGGFAVGGDLRGGWGNHYNSPQIIIGKGGGRERGKGELFRQIAMGLIAFNISWGHVASTEAHGAERVASSAAHP